MEPGYIRLKQNFEGGGTPAVESGHDAVLSISGGTFTRDDGMRDKRSHNSAIHASQVIR
ncbi:hypothetical protein SERLADRAFT_384007 [Serpula lacrymans var. lacrymans S7.9]|uniref:Uncharacterized protein n=1 Tax=Serpula lacrymans var. lacrymans (strain S7.9) TaxID=578457 RepID=F8NNJ0_SERL9|nr:uncharacterized protein SERLADRAFT_384007 [Serpula lacrymans var. lacrymans S7.9]EGO28047.1 hypothetical protein SERLADRAFT_384007 [Serpula lacrymans var. lacrymans S7.9]